MGSEHSFDSHAFKYSLLVIAGGVALGAIGQSLFSYGQYLVRAPVAPLIISVHPIKPAPVAPTPSVNSRAIPTITLDEVLPAKGKFISADLTLKTLTLYEDGAVSAQYPILTIGKPGTPYETPSGEYSILTKEVDHFNAGEQVHMPYSMEFYGNYFIHGWPVYTDGTPVASTYSGGCIRLSTDDAKKVYAFAQKNTGIFVSDVSLSPAPATLPLATLTIPDISAESYLIADLDTGDVYAERDAQNARPIDSVTKLMTALVANETIMFDRKISVARGKLKDIEAVDDTKPETFAVGDLMYPLLMQSNNPVADTLARHYGTHSFVAWMNNQAKALHMSSTVFADPSGASVGNVSTPDDLYRLAVYLANRKSFVWKITRTPSKTITASDGSEYTFSNYNEFAGLDTFVGGKVGHTTPAGNTMLSVFSLPIDGESRRIAVVVLGSQDYTSDTTKLADWFDESATAVKKTACLSCLLPHMYRKIAL